MTVIQFPNQTSSGTSPASSSPSPDTNTMEERETATAPTSSDLHQSGESRASTSETAGAGAGDTDTSTNSSASKPDEETVEEIPSETLLASYPVGKLNKLEELISNPRWIIPVLPKAELESLLEASVALAKRGIDNKSEACQRFYREGLIVSFTKIMTDEAVSSWRIDIHKCILKNCEHLIELCVLKLFDDTFPLYDLLAMVLNPGNKFHMYNAQRSSDLNFPPENSDLQEPYAASFDVRTPRGWLVDLINRFGHHGGFEKILERFKNLKDLNVPLIHVLIKPFGQCFELLSQNTLKKYLLPIVEIVPKYLESLSDEDLKKETKSESKNDAFSTILKSLKNIASAVPCQEENIRQLEMFRLKMILRQLQVSSFGGKMNALNEVNRVIASATYYPQRQPNTVEDEDFLTSVRMATWLKENKVLQIVLQDSLHQPQYVEKLEKVIRFLIKENALSLEDLDDIWAAQVGQHEVIVKNIHDLLAKLAWNFSPEQLDRLFVCFQTSWSSANSKQREKLLELIRRLAEDDKDGMMAEKVLTLFWSMAHNAESSNEVLDQALAAHVKILDYSCTQYRDAQRSKWLQKSIEELKNNKNWVLPALKQIREICCLYREGPPNNGISQGQIQFRHEIINNLQSNHALVILVADNLTNYINEVRKYSKEVSIPDPAEYYPDKRYNHLVQVQDRLGFLRFLLKDGQLWLCAPQAKQIWKCLAENSVFQQDRDICFKWFSKLMGEEPDLDPEINKDFFENNILQLDPSLMTESGIKCFERFFKAVNSKENKLIPKRRGFMMDNLELIGLDYIWRLILRSQNDIANKAIDLLKDTFTNLGPNLQQDQVAIHEDFISSCTDRLKASFDTLSVIEKDKDTKFQQEVTRLCRVLQVLHRYITECDYGFVEERTFLPLFRASRGSQMMLTIRFPNQGRQIEDIDIWTHSNETLSCVRRQIMQRLKINSSNVKLELFPNGESFEPISDRKTLHDLDIRDKTLLTGKLSQVGGNLVSSPDSSSDSSTSSPRHHYDGPNVEVELGLPGVLMSKHKKYCQFLLQLADSGSSLNHDSLQKGAWHLLEIIPADEQTIEILKSTCMEHINSKKPTSSHWDNIFFNKSPSQTLYNLEALCSLLLPSSVGSNSEKIMEFQLAFVKSKGISAVINMLTRNNFLAKANLRTKKRAYLTLLKISKLIFTIAGNSLVHMVAEACQPDSSVTITQAIHSKAVVLQQALMHIPSPQQEVFIRSIGQRLASHLMELGASPLPDPNTIAAVIRLAWASACGNLSLLNNSFEELHTNFLKKEFTPDGEDISICRESLEVLALSIALHPQSLDALCKEKYWQNFIIDLVLLNEERGIRLGAAEQFNAIATHCSGEQNPLRYFITLLFTVQTTTVPEKQNQCTEYFLLLSKLLSFTASSNFPYNSADTLLSREIKWLKEIMNNVKQNGVTGCSEPLLEGHLLICRDLISFMSCERKAEIGNSPSCNINLVKDLLENFLFPSSCMMVKFRQTNEIDMNQPTPVCSTSPTIMAAFDLLVSLCTGCPSNLKLVAKILMDMFYTDKNDVLTEWDYLPPIGPRPKNGFVGLKNAGATCYMNSVLQQLYMIEGIRKGILSAKGTCNDPNEDFSGEDKDEDLNEADLVENEETRKEYNLTILKQIQAIFAHLAKTNLQFYIPKGLWKHFRMNRGEPVNLREQQDAVEFFMRIFEVADDALKELGNEQKMMKILGGILSDQKICKTCPHRYSKEQSFSSINVVTKNYNNLTSSLHEYVKGELLDGSNAYYCERCDKKVDTIKRLCVKKLPPVLVILLKRFEYDYERECPIKFNDYFEFPRELDMEPYTIAGLTKIEGEAVDCDPSDLEDTSVKNYNLRGMVVHSGQASGGHYYSYIKSGSSWYKFDDCEVTEVKMDDDEELRNQCYGGEYMSEVFDPILKRLSYRKQKRWWNAYMLFYTRADIVEDKTLIEEIEKMSLSETKDKEKDNSHRFDDTEIPAPIEKSIQKQNISFLHHRNQYSPEYFNFMRKLLNCNSQYVTLLNGQGDKLTPEREEIASITVQLASHFLFKSGFRTKKSLRGPANEWYENLAQYLRYSKQVRLWFCQNFLFTQPSRFSEYILESPNAEVRIAFVRIIVYIAHFSINDGPCPVPLHLQQIQQKDETSGNNLHHIATGTTISDHLLQTVLLLLWGENSEHGRNFAQYFALFFMYSTLGVAEKTQLLKLNLPAIFIQVALEEGPGPPLKYQYSELAKLFQVVSQLIRCYDVSSISKSSAENKSPLPNPYIEASCPNKEPLLAITPLMNELVFQRFTYLKKIIEEANSSDDTRKLLQFCAWENPTFSHAVLHELLWQVGIVYAHELRPYLDLLLQILLMEDSWQNFRIQKAFTGIPDEHNTREGMFEIIHRSKTHYQKRSYQCIKMLVALFSQSPCAKSILDSISEIKRKWIWSVEWLSDELERGRGMGTGTGTYNPGSSGQYSYNNWSPPAQSNESVNGYFLERSHSARMTLEKACELLPEEDTDAEEHQKNEENESRDGTNNSEAIASESNTSQSSSFDGVKVKTDDKTRRENVD